MLQREVPRDADFALFSFSLLRPINELRGARWGFALDAGAQSERMLTPLDDEPEQDALFGIEGPDEDGCVWICSTAGLTDWCQNLGPRAKAVKALCQ